MTTARREAERALARLMGDGVLRRDGERLRTARRFQRAMTRAVLHVFGQGDPGEDLRVPIAFALLEIYGDDCTDEELAELVEIVVPVETAELAGGAAATVSAGGASAG